MEVVTFARSRNVNEHDKGLGVYNWGEGDLYTGQWKRGHPHGHGVFVWSDGRLYDGEYIQGQKEGKGYVTLNAFFVDEGIVHGQMLTNDSSVECSANIVL